MEHTDIEDQYLQINIENDVRDKLVTAFITEFTSPVTLRHFNALLTDGKTIEEAVFQAVLNEAIILTLEDQIEREKNKVHQNSERSASGIDASGSGENSEHSSPT